MRAGTRRWLITLAALATLACAPRPVPYAPTKAPPIAASAPALDDAGVGLALSNALPLVVLAKLDRMIEAYEALAGDAGADCAEENARDTSNGDLYDAWTSDGCARADGTTFSGSADIHRYSGRVRDDGAIESGFSFEGDSLTVAAPDGRTLHVGGFLFVARDVAADGSSTDASLSWSGSFALTGFGDDLPPLLQGAIAGDFDGSSYKDADTQSLDVNAVVSGTAFAPTTAITLTQVHAANDGCAAEPSGSAALRDASATWHDVAFDADAGGACDGCAGAACLDASTMTALLDWQEFPW